jgi:hypothetical protein
MRAVPSPRRRRCEFTFLGLWLTGWTCGAVAAMHKVAGDRPSAVLNLCFWIGLESCLAIPYLRGLAAGETLDAAPEEPRVVARGRARVLAVDRVRAVSMQRIDFGRRIVSRGEPRVRGRGRDEREARPVAPVGAQPLAARVGRWAVAVSVGAILIAFVVFVVFDPPQPVPS